MAPLSWDPEPKEHTMEDMTEFEADAIGAAMLKLADSLEAIASRSSYRDAEEVTAAWLESASMIRATLEPAA